MAQSPYTSAAAPLLRLAVILRYYGGNETGLTNTAFAGQCAPRLEGRRVHLPVTGLSISAKDLHHAIAQYIADHDANSPSQAPRFSSPPLEGS